MSGLGEIGELPGFTFGGAQVSQKDMDQYYNIQVSNPAVSASWFGTFSGGTAGTNNPITKLNQLADWPRNVLYSIPGVASGTFGGTFTCNYLDQFGSAITETVVIPSAAPAVGIFGTAIVMKFISGTFASQGSSGGSLGTASIGFGTTTNAGTSQSNWFGLMTKIGGTNDLKLVHWVNNGTTTTLNAGTSIGSLVDTTRHAFQGTSGVQITDIYDVILKPTFDNLGKGTMCRL